MGASIAHFMSLDFICIQKSIDFQNKPHTWCYISVLVDFRSETLLVCQLMLNINFKNSFFLMKKKRFCFKKMYIKTL